MKIILLHIFSFCLLSIPIFGQTTVWSSDSSDFTTFGAQDLDGDGFNWGIYEGGAEFLGFESGHVFFSESYDLDTSTELTPDNLLFTPEGEILIPSDAQSIMFKMKVAALDENFPAETFAVYVYDEAGDPNFDTQIFETTLTSGGDDTAIDISAEIPNTFAGKQIALIIRHFNTTGQNQLLVDDFSVTSDDTLSIDNVVLDSVSIHPNPTKGIITINTPLNLNSAVVFNQLGQKVLSIAGNPLSDKEIDLSSLRNGFYMMKILADGKQKTIKFIKEN